MKYIVIEVILLISCFFYVKMLMFVAKKLFGEAENENTDNLLEERNISGLELRNPPASASQVLG